MTDKHALSRRRARRILAAVAGGVALAGAVPPAGAAPAPPAGRCAVASGPQTTPLVELYTSEGCSSCPPADRWLSTTVPPGAAGAVALAFHVDYWDRLGWHDRFATAAFTERQYDAMRANRARFVYTPQVLLQGRDWTGHRADAASSLAAVRARPARAAIALAAVSREGTIAIDATTTVGAPADRADARLFVALVDSGHVSDVKAGENSGVRLVHDHVVRAISPPQAAGATTSLALPWPAERGSAPALVAFIQRSGSGEVLQAVRLPLDAPDCGAAR